MTIPTGAQVGRQPGVPYKEEIDPATGQVVPVQVDIERSGKTMTEINRAAKIAADRQKADAERAAQNAPTKGQRYKKWVVVAPGGSYNQNGVLIKLAAGKILSEQHFNIEKIKRYGIKLLPYAGPEIGDAETRFGY